MSADALIFALPPDLHFTGVTPLSWHRVSGAQNLSDTLNSRRATRPWVFKNFLRCGSISAPGFPSQRHRCEYRRRGGPCGRPVFPVRIPAGAPRGSPTQFREISLSAVGEGLAPPAASRNGLQSAAGAGPRPARLAGSPEKKAAYSPRTFRSKKRFLYFRPPHWETRPATEKFAAPPTTPTTGRPWTNLTASSF